MNCTVKTIQGSRCINKRPKHEKKSGNHPAECPQQGEKHQPFKFERHFRSDSLEQEILEERNYISLIGTETQYPPYPQFHFLWFQLHKVNHGPEAHDPPDVWSEGQEQPSAKSQCLRHSAH